MLLDVLVRQAKEISKLQRDLKETTELLDLASSNYERSRQIIIIARTIVTSQKARLAAYEDQM